MRLDPRIQTFNKFKLVSISPKFPHPYLHYLADIFFRSAKAISGWPSVKRLP